MTTFETWLDTFLTEKRVDLDTPIVVDGPSGPNHMAVGTVVAAMKATGAGEQSALQRNLIRIDFANGDVVDYLRHLAQAIAV